jgi:Protein of unknown function, DUF481
MMSVRTVATLLLSLSCTRLQAQLNESDTVKFQLRTSFTGNYQRGNVNILTLRGRLDITYAPLRNIVFKTQNSSLYQELFSVKADNDIFSRNYIYFKPSKRLYPFGIAYISANYRRKISTRIFAGTGITLQALNKPGQSIKISAATVYERSRFTDNRYNQPLYNGSKIIDCWRATFYTGGRNYFFQNRLRIYYDAYWQPALNDRKNYRTQFDIGIDCPVWKGLSFTSLYTYTHEHVVISGIQQSDRIFTVGLSYNLRLQH